jgi:hypothetical protein
VKWRERVEMGKKKEERQKGKEGGRKRIGDTALMALKMEEGNMNRKP